MAGPEFKHPKPFSFLIVTANQRNRPVLNAIVNNGGTENACGWCRTMGLPADHAAGAAGRNDRSDREAAKRPRSEKRVREKPESGGKYLQLHN